MKKISLEDGGAPARRGLVLYPARAFADLDETFGRAGDGEQNGTPWALGACLCREKRASQVWLLSGCRTELQGRKVSTQRRCGFVEGASSAQKHLQQRISTHSGHKSHYAAVANEQKTEVQAAKSALGAGNRQQAVAGADFGCLERELHAASQTYGAAKKQGK